MIDWGASDYVSNLNLSNNKLESVYFTKDYNTEEHYCYNDCKTNDHQADSVVDKKNYLLDDSFKNRIDELEYIDKFNNNRIDELEYIEKFNNSKINELEYNKRFNDSKINELERELKYKNDTENIKKQLDEKFENDRLYNRVSKMEKEYHSMRENSISNSLKEKFEKYKPLKDDNNNEGISYNILIVFIFILFVIMVYIEIRIYSISRKNVIFIK